jgi:hypothetical protein
MIGETMKQQLFLTLAVIFFIASPAFAQNNPGLTVDDIRICTSVEDRQPVGADTSFARNIGHVYCFTGLSGDKEYSTLYHVWYYKDREMLRVELNAKAKKWRTWSTKRIQTDWTGNWRVDVLSSDGNMLGSIEFTIRE